MFFFFKQKTAYEMRISDWSSDVCSSDLFYVIKSAPAKNFDETSSVPPTQIIFSWAELNKLDSDVKKARSAILAGLMAPTKPRRLEQIGRTSCRERVCQYV